jgi:hypothetical protein
MTINGSLQFSGTSFSRHGMEEITCIPILRVLAALTRGHDTGMR